MFAAFESEIVEREIVPMSVRGDKGGENLLVSNFMFFTRPDEPKAFMAGRSTQNQRIERIWRDMRKDVVNYYRSLFYHFVAKYGVDFDNPLTVYCIHYLFIPRINEDLKRFANSWNMHRLRTEKGNKTPNMLLQQAQHLNPPPLPLDADENYGADENYDPEEPEDDLPQVIIDSIQCALNASQLQYFQQHISPLTLRDSDVSDIWQRCADAFACIEYCLNRIN